MSGGDLALETQLLLQEATLITQHVAVESVLESASAPPVESELEAAKRALLTKLRKKKEANRAQHQELNQRRLRVPETQFTTKQTDMLSPRKAFKLPVAATTAAASRKKLDMLSKLRTQAIQQGAQNLAIMFGYATYEEHYKSLAERENEKLEADEKEKEEGDDEMEFVEKEEGDDEMEFVEKEDEEDGEMELGEATVVAVETQKEVSVLPGAADEKEMHSTEGVHESLKVVKRRIKIHRQEDSTEDDGNEADSELEEKDDGDEMQDVTATQMMNTAQSTIVKDKAAGYRDLLRAEALQNRQRKSREKFVESEAEEEEEEDVLKIGGLGDFGFGVPQAKTQESKEAEDERNALKLREDDLDHIVDELSDDERAEEQDLEEIFRREQEDQDRQQVKEVMRNVKEGFGRNRRAFSGLHASSEARGRFNLDELVAADGNKFDAARLGLLESDEELSDKENGKKENSIEEGEEDEEAEMERMLRERFQNQPKIYVTSSESGSEDENEDETKKYEGDDDEIASDEERERQQIKLFSERARINRRMQRMKDMQRQIALDTNQVDSNVKSNTAMPNLLLEEDEDSQELMHMMNRTDVNGIGKAPQTDRLRPKVGRFHSFGTITSASSSSSSFSRVIGHCKLFSADSTGGGTASSKGFVFTSFSNEKTVDSGDENATLNYDKAVFAARPEIFKSKSRNIRAATKRRTTSGGAGNAHIKKRKIGDLFSVLSSYQCVSSTRHESKV